MKQENFQLLKFSKGELYAIFAARFHTMLKDRFKNFHLKPSSEKIYLKGVGGSRFFDLICEYSQGSLPKGELTNTMIVCSTTLAYPGHDVIQIIIGEVSAKLNLESNEKIELFSDEHEIEFVLGSLTSKSKDVDETVLSFTVKVGSENTVPLVEEK